MQLFLVIPSFLQDAFKTLAYLLAGVGAYSHLVALPYHLSFLTCQRARRQSKWHNGWDKNKIGKDCLSFMLFLYLEQCSI